MDLSSVYTAAASPSTVLALFFWLEGWRFALPALFVLPCVVIAGAMIFGAGRIRRLLVVAALVGAILLPSGISILLNKTMSHHDGAFNANLSYTVYGLVTGGKGWEQYERDNPHALNGLAEAERSHVILQASWQHFRERPIDLAKGLVKAQLLGPVQTFAQVARLAFLGAAGDPRRIIPSAAIIVVSLCFAGVLWGPRLLTRNAPAINRNLRLFGIMFIIGYLLSIPFFYQDGGLRVHAAVLPIVSYMLVRGLLPLGRMEENVLKDRYADRLVAGTTVFGFILLGLVGWVCLVHPKSDRFDVIPLPEAGLRARHGIVFRFSPGWPQCDLRIFERGTVDRRPHWFSGPISDDNYRSAAIWEISGQGHLYFGFDAGARQWKIFTHRRTREFAERRDDSAGRA